MLLLLILLLNEVHAEGVNLAKGKPTRQSSTTWNAPSSRAVDGTESGDFFGKQSCTHSRENEKDPWWRVDLRYNYQIDEIVIYGRDNFQWRFAGAQVRVGYNDGHNHNANPLCKDSITVSNDVQQKWSVRCTGMNGRFVTIAIPGNRNTLTLCEVKVFGKPIPQTNACYHGYGKDYRGNGAVTKSGRTCQAWSSQSPHGHSRTPRNYRHADLEANYCRNPDGEDAPWCYTTDPDTRWEECFNKPVCDNDWREDLRCGPHFKLANGKRGQCNPEDPNGFTCCSDHGWCGNTVLHCHCDQCINYSKDNLARGKTAIQSTTDHNGPAYKAIDGIRGRGYTSSASCTHTYDGWNNAGTSNPWWRVDLYNEYTVGKVVVTNREDCCSERLNGFQVRLGMSSSKSWDANPLCGTSTKVVSGKLVYTVDCKGRTGRFVTVTVPGKNKILTLCEVEVYGGVAPKDPCADNTCNDNADCIPSRGSYTCKCQDGYEGDGRTCEKVNECDRSPCHAQAVCIPLDTGYSCVCKDGYDGDGETTCSDVNECDNSEACDEGATCANNNGSYTCKCDEGYAGDGYSCQNIDECGTNTHLCLPDVADCYDNEGSYNCECTEGFNGDGRFNCTDIDECSEYQGVCSYPNSVCANTFGSFKCVCEEGYNGDPSQCEKHFDDTETATVFAVNPVISGKLGGFAKFLIKLRTDTRLHYDRIKWTKLPDISLSPPPFDHIKTPYYRRNLVIRQILPSDGGEYMVDIEGIEDATATVMLTIDDPIYAVQQNITAKLGDNVRFDITYNVWPQPPYKDVSWRKGDKNLSPPPRPKINTPNNRRQLIINNVSKADEGEYTVTLKLTIRGQELKRHYSVFLNVLDKEEL